MELDTVHLAPLGERVGSNLKLWKLGKGSTWTGWGVHCVEHILAERCSHPTLCIVWTFYLHFRWPNIRNVKPVAG